MSSAGRVLYRALVREANKLTHYNFRSYALRRIRSAFDESKNVTDPKEVTKLLQYANDSLALIRRQAIVQHLYTSEKMILENKPDIGGK